MFLLVNLSNVIMRLGCSFIILLWFGSFECVLMLLGLWSVVDNFEFWNFFICIKLENIYIVESDCFFVSEGLVVEEIDSGLLGVMGLKNM